MLKQLLTTGKEKFNAICRANDLTLSYYLNKPGFPILEEVFVNRVYADYFPFYQQAVVVDIGAHFGFFSIFASKNLAPESRIIAIEPARANFERIETNARMNGLSNIEPANAAILDNEGFVDLYMDRAENHSIFGKSGSAKVSVEAMTLESLFLYHKLQQIDFLKLDCEGAEYPILLNTPDAVFESIKTISLEFHDLKDKRYTGLILINRLKALGYKIVKFQHGKTNQNNNYGWIVATREY